MAIRLRRDQVPEELTWNLQHIYPTTADWEVDAERVEAEIETVVAYRGRLGEGAPRLLACLRARDALRQRLGRVHAYANLAISADTTSPLNQAMSARVAALQAKVNAELAFIPTELAALPQGRIEGYLAGELELGPYRYQLERLIAQRSHILAPETEEALAALGEALSLPATIFRQTTAADLECPPISAPSGEEIPVSIARYVFGLSESPDRQVRRRAYESLTAGLNRHKNTLATALATEIRRNVAMARLRRYPSAVDMILDEQQVPREVYQNVLDVVHDEGAPHVRRLMRLRQRVLGLDRVHRYDMQAPLDPEFQPTATFEDCARIVPESLRALGPEYGEIVAAAFRDRWIDRADNVGKRSGAFCSTVYGVHSYIFTTWQDSLRSALVMAHELGHAGHFMLAGRSQVISNVRPSLFFVEAPSTANEMLAGQHLLDTRPDPRLRRWVIAQFLGTFTHNMVTHLLEAHFEQRLYDLAEAGKPLTLKGIMDAQAEVFERYFGDTVAVDDGARLYWAQQPHFYYGLYPYTYAAGLACAVNVVDAIRCEGQPAVDRWLQTLRAGGTMPPLELMRLAGVDLADPEPIHRAVAFFGGLVDELERSYAREPSAPTSPLSAST